MTPSELRASLTLPVVVAPMLLVSGPELVIAGCKAGLIGAFPASNTRTIEDRESWRVRIEAELAAERAARPDARIGPYAVNLIVRGAGTEAFAADLELMRRF